MEFPVIISFFTEATPYALEVEHLRSSLEKFSLDHEIKGIPSQGAWELNCAYKPFFILEQLEKWQKPVLWVDADGVFINPPTWQEAFESDLAVRINESLEQDHPSRVITSTVFVRPSEEGIALVRAWIYQCQKMLLDPTRTEEFWDQIALREALSMVNAKISPMPLSYAKIFDHPEDCSMIVEPVIEHYQASRRYKKFLNEG